SVWKLTRGLQLSGGFGYQDARYNEFDNAGGPGVNAAGKRLLFVPKWTANLSGQYGYDLPNAARIVLRADYSYVGSRYSDALNDPFRLRPSYWLTNARIGYVAPRERWQLFLWGNNVANHRYATSVDVDQFAADQSNPVKLITYGRPRTFG